MSATTNAPPAAFGQKALFAKELRLLLHAFGDDPNPREDTLELVERLLIDYLCNLVSTSPLDHASHGGKQRNSQHR